MARSEQRRTNSSSPPCSASKLTEQQKAKKRVKYTRSVSKEPAEKDLALARFLTQYTTKRRKARKLVNYAKSNGKEPKVQDLIVGGFLEGNMNNNGEQTPSGNWPPRHPQSSTSTPAQRAAWLTRNDSSSAAASLIDGGTSTRNALLLSSPLAHMDPEVLAGRSKESLRDLP